MATRPPGITSEGPKPTSRPQLIRVNLAPPAHGVNAIRPLTNKQSVRFTVVACTRTKSRRYRGAELNLKPRDSVPSAAVGIVLLVPTGASPKTQVSRDPTAWTNWTGRG